MTFLSLRSVATFGVIGILAALLLAVPQAGNADASEVSWSDLPDRSVQAFEDP